MLVCDNAINIASRFDDINSDPQYPRNTRTPLPETIRVDYLLNIIWLSNPSNEILNSEQLNIGISSMVSHALNASLPKSRVIKELDDNIQKYKDDFSITDKDVVYLSTRIAQRQIEDVEALNNIAQKDGEKFAQKVKEEAFKQASKEAERARKMDALLHEMSNKIEELRQSKENQDQVYSLQKISLEEERKKLRDDLNQEKKMTQEEIKRITNLLDKENQAREEQWEAYKDTEFKKKQRSTSRLFYGSLIIGALVMGVGFISQELQSFLSVSIFPNRVICSIAGSLLSIAEAVIVTNYINWNFIPSTETTFKNNLKRPEYLKQLHYNDISEK